MLLCVARHDCPHSVIDLRVALALARMRCAAYLPSKQQREARAGCHCPASDWPPSAAAHLGTTLITRRPPDPAHLAACPATFNGLSHRLTHYRDRDRDRGYRRQYDPNSDNTHLTWQAARRVVPSLAVPSLPAFLLASAVVPILVVRSSHSRSCRSCDVPLAPSANWLEVKCPNDYSTRAQDLFACPDLASCLCILV